ncbi:MAG: hypothetical protein ACFBRM_13200 [Pikeienuella sp.]
MKFKSFQLNKLMLASSVSALALAPSVAMADPAAKIAELQANGAYLAGDKHNHTTCTDGATSVQTLVNQSLEVYDLDWFAQTGHGGSGNRDCRFDDNPGYFAPSQVPGDLAIDEAEGEFASGSFPNPFTGNAFSGDGDSDGDGVIDGDDVLWTDTIGADAIKGRENIDGGGSDEGTQRMWRWQSLYEYAYDLQRTMGEVADKPTWLAIEHVAPGHEHVNVSAYAGQLTARGNAYATAQFEYLWDRADDDISGGEELDFENPANRGVPKEQDDDIRNASETGTAGRFRAVESVEWLVANYPESYYTPAHVERQGAFDPEGTRGWNVEDFRLLHTAGLLDPTNPEGESIVFGAEMLAGHQFENGGRGTYELDRPTAGFGTYGGAGAYSGAEVTVPGFAFDGGEADIAIGSFNPETGAPVSILVPTDGEALEVADLEAIAADFDAVFEGRLTEPSGSDQFDSFRTDLNLVRYTLGRPGLNTMWDALLGEGRRFWNFSSSDWHNRDIFGPFEPQSTLDPWPGEYNRIYAYATDGNVNSGFNQNAADAIIAGMRTGNTYSTHGQIISDFFWAICQGDNCATLGETLVVDPAGEDLEYQMVVVDPAGTNFSPYTFNNPSLLQIGLEEPINAPVLKHVDVILGQVTGLIEPEDEAFTTNVANPTVALFDRLERGDFTIAEDGETLTFTGPIPLEAAVDLGSFYVRARGTNMPVGTPNETDLNGNPLLDDFASLIPCTAVNPEPGAFDPQFCPEHLPVTADGTKYIDADVEAWADLWFYTSPIFITVAQ